MLGSAIRIAALSFIPTLLRGRHALEPPGVARQSPISQEELGVARFLSTVDAEEYGPPAGVLLVLRFGHCLDAWVAADTVDSTRAQRLASQHVFAKSCGAVLHDRCEELARVGWALKRGQVGRNGEAEEWGEAEAEEERRTHDGFGNYLGWIRGKWVGDAEEGKAVPGAFDAEMF